jgi:hypothetical protein
MLFSMPSVANPFMLKPKTILALNTWDIDRSEVPPRGVLRPAPVWAFIQRKAEGRWFDPRWCHGIFH